MFGVRLPIAAIAAFVAQSALVWVWIAMVCAHLVQATLLSVRWRGQRWQLHAEAPS